jgi:hypothetical protein
MKEDLKQIFRNILALYKGKATGNRILTVNLYTNGDNNEHNLVSILHETM